MKPGVGLCVSEHEAEAPRKSSKKEEQAWEKNPVHDQLSDKTYVHIMTSITLKAGWQMQQIGQMAPKEIEMTV